MMNCYIDIYLDMYEIRHTIKIW